MSDPVADTGNVNQMSDPVFGPGESVEVTVLGQTSPPFSATVLEMSGPALRLTMSGPLSTGTPVKLEGAGTLLLADVSFCDPASGGATVGVTVRHMLTALAELTRLGRALLEAEGSRNGSPRDMTLHDIVPEAVAQR